MLQNLTGWHLILILAVVLLIFGAAKLPALAKSLGQSTRILKAELRSGAEEDPAAKPTATVAEPAASVAPAAEDAPVAKPVNTLHHV